LNVGRRPGKNLERFTTNKDPEILALPDTAWIYKSAERTSTKEAA
jgi:putative transposase